jgi:hypothetical protein
MADYETQTVVAFAATIPEAKELLELLSDYGIEAELDRDYDGPGCEEGNAIVVEEEFEEEARAVVVEHSELDVFASAIETDDEVIDVDSAEENLLGTELDSTGQFLGEDGAPVAKEVAGLEESPEEDVPEEEAPDFMKALFGGEGLGDDPVGDSYAGPRDLFDDAGFFEDAGEDVLGGLGETAGEDEEAS